MEGVKQLSAYMYVWFDEISKGMEEGVYREDKRDRWEIWEDTWRECSRKNNDRMERGNGYDENTYEGG